MHIESKIGTIKKPENEIFNFLSDFKNIEKFIPPDKIKNWEATSDSCKFSVDMAGDILMKIIDKEPNKTIKFIGETSTQPISFFFWIQLKEVAPDDTKVKLTLKAELPKMIEMMAKKLLQEALNLIVDRLNEIFNKII
ncbi:MAG: SRPBCC family protein [Bacteroidales bacterium]|nr:SRPBCC family protein [Bacteroidales bacterium]